ncbi:MAG: hypothetical protein H7138_22625 [Myxococcales bacterium]|nr:hypothetical protein [Myxococcales bacterium]
MSRFACLWGVLVVAMRSASAAPVPTVIATCGDSQVEVTAGVNGETASLRAVVVSGATRWSFTANVGLARVGAKTRTITVEDLKTEDRKPASKAAAPSGLFVDLLLDDKKLILRHASEGGSDPAYAVDLGTCSFDGDAAIAALVPPPAEPVGCTPAVVKGAYRTQVTKVATLPDAEAEHEARRLCEAHQPTIEARARLEAAISDRAARDRVAARGRALMRTEEARMKAWNRIDGCLGADAAKAGGVAGLHEREAKERACYQKMAAKL